MSEQPTSTLTDRQRQQASTEYLLAVAKDIVVTETHELSTRSPALQHIDMHPWLSELLNAIDQLQQDMKPL